MKNSIRWYFSAAVGLLCGAGCTLQPVAPQPVLPPAAARAAAPDALPGTPVSGYDAVAYRVSPLDPVTIQFSGTPEQQSMQLVVDEKGQINLPHIGLVSVTGLTTSELEREIERRYKDGQIYRNVSINVIMTAKSYYIQGEVNAPGQFPLAAETTLMQAIAAARGVSPYASSRVTVTRKGQTFRYDIGDIRRHPERDVKIEAGDVINVQRSWF